ncbi:MAG: hypothetical protein HY582_03810 [Candidatus Omnitrophica bacterium]|nr:hypothetical protein [Candidatus Omnitrophota bacterium]
MKYEDRELLERIIHFYHTRLFEEQTAHDYLKKVGLSSQETCIQFRLGFSGGLSSAIPDDQETLGKLKRLGILDDNLNEVLSDSLIVPIRSEGKTFASLMGISRLDGKEKFLPNETHLFNIEALKASKEIFLTDSVINTLLLYSIGLRNVSAIIGEGVNDSHLKLFERYQTRSVTLLVASHNTAKFAKKIKSQGIAVGFIDLDSKSFPRLVVEGLKKDYCLSLVKEPEINPAEPIIEERGEEIFYEFEDRRYRVRRLNPFRLDSLRVNLKATHQALWHLDTFDLYAERQRRNFISMAKKLIRLDQGFLYQDLLKITDDLEDRQARLILEKKPEFQEMSSLEKEEAMKFLRADDPMTEILNDFRGLGVVGEETSILTGYLALLSRKLKHPLSVILYGSAASGKDVLRDALLDVVPENDIERFTKLSPQVLFYRDELSLKNRVLVIDDEHSLKDLESVLVGLQQKGLSYSVTHKVPETGKLKSHDYKVKGPMSIMASVSDMKTVKNIVNYFLVLKADESKEQTKRILSKQRQDETLEAVLHEKKLELIKRKHRNAQKLLKNYVVVNPYAKDLEYGADAPDARTFQPKYLSLIKAICLLRQFHKEVRRVDDSQDEYIEVDLIDIEIANRLMAGLLKSRRPLSEEAAKALKDLEEYVGEKAGAHNVSKEGVSFTVKELTHFSYLTDYKARAVIEELVESGYAELLSGANGKTMEYRLSSGQRLTPELLRPFEGGVKRSTVS